MTEKPTLHVGVFEDLLDELVLGRGGWRPDTKLVVHHQLDQGGIGIENVIDALGEDGFDVLEEALPERPQTDARSLFWR